MTFELEELLPALGVTLLEVDAPEDEDDVVKERGIVEESEASRAADPADGQAFRAVLSGFFAAFFFAPPTDGKPAVRATVGVIFIDGIVATEANEVGIPAWTVNCKKSVKHFHN